MGRDRERLEQLLDFRRDEEERNQEAMTYNNPSINKTYIEGTNREIAKLLANTSDNQLKREYAHLLPFAEFRLAIKAGIVFVVGYAIYNYFN